VVAIVQAQEALLAKQAAGKAGGVVEINAADGGLVLRLPGEAKGEVLYRNPV